MPNCDRCGKHRARVTRQNPTGQAGIFWCPVCTGEESEPESKGRHMTPEKQLELWVAGESVHNDATGECCPDFSCCKPDLLWPKADRVKFAEATIYEDEDTRMSMMARSIEALANREFPGCDIEVSPELRGGDG